MDFIADLEQASSVDDHVYDEIVSTYLDTENTPVELAIKLNHIVSKGEPEPLRAVIRIFNFITETVVNSRDYEDGLGELTSTIAELAAESQEASTGWQKFLDRIPDLEKFFVVKKIENIKQRYSNVTSFQITADIRPIFDMKREQINTQIYPYILKINTSDDKTFVCEFFDDTLDTIIEELERAKEKVKVMRDRYAER